MIATLLIGVKLDQLTAYGDIDLERIGSGNGLLPDGLQPLTEPVLTYY